MNQSEDNSSMLFLGGVIAVVAVAATALKAIEAFFNQLTKTFDAFGTTVSSFFPMLLKILEMVGLVAAIVLAAVAAIYFSVRYIKMVRSATALQEYVRSELETKLSDFRADFEKKYTDKVTALTSKTSVVERKLQELLKPASAVSTSAPSPLALTAPHATTTVQTTEPNLVPTSTDTKAPAAVQAQIPVSQPY